jgi:hypothetical protein
MAKDKDFFDEEHPDETEAREKAEAARKDAEHRQAVLDMVNALRHDYVRRVLHRIIGVCSPFDSPWAPGAEMGRNVGHLEVGQHILGMIGEADPHLVGQMINDAYAKKLKESQA